ncbi:hypothetical protein Goari_003235, partial [Gossypium aridum]|nr:hypothetical protein [Gossypium aridum]
MLIETIWRGLAPVSVLMKSGRYMV